MPHISIKEQHPKIDPSQLDPTDPSRVVLEQGEKIKELTAQRDRLREEVRYWYEQEFGTTDDRRIEQLSDTLYVNDMTGE